MLQSFIEGIAGNPRPGSYSAHMRQHKKIRDQQKESQIDKTIEDSFPASDPPSWY